LPLKSLSGPTDTVSEVKVQEERLVLNAVLAVVTWQAGGGARAAAALVTLPREFDEWLEPPPGVVHVGPLTDEPADRDWQSP
jgi:hypothetical protein